MSTILNDTMYLKYRHRKELSLVLSIVKSKTKVNKKAITLCFCLILHSGHNGCPVI
jgi:hypothetical protein